VIHPVEMACDDEMVIVSALGMKPREPSRTPPPSILTPAQKQRFFKGLLARLSLLSHNIRVGRRRHA
jgi:hypothetical protein